MASLTYSIFAHTWEARNQYALETCPISMSFWGSVLSLTANALFLAFFAPSIILSLGQGVLRERFLWFTLTMVSRCALSISSITGIAGGHIEVQAVN
ncbi:uncharacterized protein BDR25DRAFT_306929 [Lindgomyces ingoldianus]|uniref:Uncharacterized protein n=1 Tax=Lindgomyces ingoldianus TaxID=673940 RepID=A0ACB6QE38_9PLEO|nr:uncharacterized protein BDR25DRAFT_306929 [Lindgomyces ingoldianus]KAF2465120.1 hypothetical protein BDR25DRAFT_306929 [Lindgomyces ingoldianus]